MKNLLLTLSIVSSLIYTGTQAKANSDQSTSSLLHQEQTQGAPIIKHKKGAVSNPVDLNNHKVVNISVLNGKELHHFYNGEPGMTEPDPIELVAQTITLHQGDFLDLNVHFDKESFVKSDFETDINTFMDLVKNNKDKNGNPSTEIKQGLLKDLLEDEGKYTELEKSLFSMNNDTPRGFLAARHKTPLKFIVSGREDYFNFKATSLGHDEITFDDFSIIGTPGVTGPFENTPSPFNFLPKVIVHIPIEVVK